MEILIAIVAAVVILYLTSRSKGTKDYGNKIVVEKKQCPPHQWFWQEVVDQNGDKHGERIVCKVCGPLAAQSGREE